VSKVVAYTLMKLPHDLFTHSDASDSFDMECGKISEDCQLVKMGRSFILLISF
jgi:hypothetical protein